jgi:hypothetical protein
MKCEEREDGLGGQGDVRSEAGDVCMHGERGTCLAGGHVHTPRCAVMCCADPTQAPVIITSP